MTTAGEPDSEVDIQTQHFKNFRLTAEMNLRSALALVALSAPQILAQPAAASYSALKITTTEKVVVLVREVDGGGILFKGEVSPGTEKIVDRGGAVYIECQSLDKVSVETAGKRFNVGAAAGPGNTKAKLTAPRKK